MVIKNTYVIKNGIEMSYKAFFKRYFFNIYKEFLKSSWDRYETAQKIEQNLIYEMSCFIDQLVRFLLWKKGYATRNYRGYDRFNEFNRFNELNIDFVAPIPHNISSDDVNGVVVVGKLVNVISTNHKNGVYCLPDDCGCC